MTAKKGVQEEVKIPAKPNVAEAYTDPRFKDLSLTSVQNLQLLGISDEKIIQALSYLKTLKKSSTTIGEVDRALDYLQKLEQRQHQEQQEQVDILLQSYDQEMNDAMELSKTEVVKLVRQKSKEPSSLATSLPV